MYFALKTTIAPAWIFLAFFGCQAMSAPFLGVFSDYIGRRKSALFSILITALTIVTAMEIIGISTSVSYVYLLELHHFTIPTQMLIILCAKALFTCTTVNARAVIADVIQIKAIKTYLH